MNKKPPLTKMYKKTGKNRAKIGYRQRRLENALFSDEKAFNLNGPEGFN